MKKTSTDETVLELARGRVAEVFDRFDLAVVSFSGGKDSTVVLNLALEEMHKRKADGRLPPEYRLRVIFWDQELIHPPTIEYVERVRQLPDVDLRWLCPPLKHRNSCSKKHPFWYAWDPAAEHLWVRPLPPHAITLDDLPGFQGYQTTTGSVPALFPRDDGLTIGLMLGIRADESLKRYRSVSLREKDNWIAPHPQAKHVQNCKPIYDWRTIDVWTAPAHFGWDYNTSYDLMARCGVSPSSQRVATPFNREALGTLHMWKLCWPELWEKLIHRIPGAATAMRYARSPLYGRGGVDVQDGESYQDAMIRELHKWTPDIRRTLVKRVKAEIRRHNRIHPGVEMPEKAPHINLETGTSSGCTWAFLLKVVVKGDVKHRMEITTANCEDVFAARDEAWGVEWRTKRPDLAAKTFWNAKLSQWELPASKRTR